VLGQINAERIFFLPPCGWPWQSLKNSFYFMMFILPLHSIFIAAGASENDLKKWKNISVGHLADQFPLNSHSRRSAAAAEVDQHFGVGSSIAGQIRSAPCPLVRKGFAKASPSAIPVSSIV